MSQHYAETPYGFEWGAARVQRAFSDDKRGWVTLTLDTPKHAGHDSLQIYVTRTGKVRIYDSRGEWSPPNKGMSVGGMDPSATRPPEPERKA